MVAGLKEELWNIVVEYRCGNLGVGERPGGENEGQEV